MLQPRLFLCIAFVGPLLSFPTFPGALQEDAFLIETRRESDQVDVKTDGDKSIFSVHSPVGISQAIIRRRREKWAAKIEVRLHLKALENFQIATTQTTLNAAASVQDGELKLRVWKDDAEDRPLTKDSKYWMDIRIAETKDHAAATIPLTSGYFTFAVPAALLASNPKSITLKWIDFYRN
jgi:hypothetical protein